jgi:K+-sensing histidine kinase KdpD
MAVRARAASPPRWRTFSGQALQDWAKWPPVLIGISCAVAWPFLTWLIALIPVFGHFYGVPLALAAVVLAAWAGGMIAGLTTTALSALTLYAILPNVRVVSAAEEATWHGLIFVLSAVLMSGFEASLTKQRQRLKRDREMRDEFLGIMSHELRTPMTVLYGSVRILSARWEALQAEARSELLREIESECERLIDMTENLLGLSRLGLVQSVQGEPLEPGRVVQQAVEDFHRHAPDRQVILDVKDPNVMVQGQVSFVQAVMRNLLSNADKFSPPKKPIVVGVERHGGDVLVAVRDSGPGVSGGRLEAIFEPYFRDPALAAGTRGFGLGLTLCKRAVEAMGGRIWAELSQEGGLQVSFTLPVMRVAPA